MEWIKIEPGCEMPAEGETVLTFNSYRQWSEGEHSCARFYVDAGLEIEGVTHWMRVELPA
ncbi:hypothetical protein QSH39_014630 [Xanthomonas arboricola pv. corylina]|uniref:hypothetical protein n=1 Tax=Xanthomonas arboricola TaxID=56448 RepID=UPI000CEDFC1D|nr:hypothetical protein [Xanthomonas arboricola]MDN0202770.1 hypothetical protein [Xanthomonas arboricola pv. corylina]MDN0215323.1 hypothetical protein [Xanthomonas arboricola pv. corylina]PPU46753.1 hypothetical protein XarbCFBP7697_13950 [Xanthomonas arboricola]